MMDKIPDILAMMWSFKNDDGTFDYKWIGPEDAPVAVSPELLAKHPSFAVDSPWNMVKVGTVTLLGDGPEGASGVITLFKRQEFVHEGVD